MAAVPRVPTQWRPRPLSAERVIGEFGARAVSVRPRARPVFQRVYPLAREGRQRRAARLRVGRE
eukprot:5430681-Lingulodinium_polyedra.AAC.1